MRILIINSVCGIKSTGKICLDIAKKFMLEGHEVRIAYGREKPSKESEKIAVRIGCQAQVYAAACCARIFDDDGFINTAATRKFLLWAESFDPDILWLHNLHGYYINVELLFDWIKSRPNMIVKWTLHDCWTFTGHCAHFSSINCEKWKTHCNKCIQKKSYPKSLFFDHSAKNYKKKRDNFCGVKNMELITPSNWLAALVQQSFLSEYPVSVVHNTIDTKVFCRRKSDFRERLGLTEKRVVLGVASCWNKSKGLDDFIQLSKMLNDTYSIVLVGVTPKQIRKLPSNIVAIERTNDAVELAQLYTAADVYVNLTYEDTYPTVNLEAQACGTPCITYRTGGSPESVPEENVVNVGNLHQVIKRIEEICEDNSSV